ncbi:ankyrin [Martensiomyces pterosporus]|nr:ankyrin [Martensiomyces pterosporus]
MAHEKNIWIAVSDDDIDRVKSIISADKTQANAQDENGYSPLHAASSWKRLDIMKYLLENGADVNIKDADGDTPLHICEDKECATVLLEHGADPEAKNDEGRTPVHTTLENEAAEVTQLLCDKLGIPVPTLEEIEEIEEPEEPVGSVSEAKLQDLSNWIMQQVDDKDEADEDALREMVTKYIMKNLRVSSGGADEGDDTVAATVATSTDKKSLDNESTTATTPKK